MLATALLVIAICAAAVSVVSGLAYMGRCRRLEDHLDTSVPDYAEDKDGHGVWYRQRWALERKRVRTAIPVFISYIAGMISIVSLQSLKAPEVIAHLPLVLMLLCTSGLLMVGLRSIVHNHREFELELKRRYPWGRQ